MGGKHLHKAKLEPVRLKGLHSKLRNSQKNKSTSLSYYNHAKQVNKKPEENLSFCGCGFLGIYHVGVASCFHEYAPQLSMHKIAGSSAGAIVAVAHICGNLQLAYATTGFLRVAIDARSRSLGPFHPSFDINAIVRDALDKGLPDDVHIKATGRLHISLTRVHDGENVIISKFDSKEDVIQAIICSCFIPFWSGLVAPKYKGVTYIDGGFSNNLLILDDKTITVSPFSGEADICPQDEITTPVTINLSNTSFSLTPDNLYRLSHALLPPPPEELSELCERGFADGIRFLQKMNLISCTRCLEIRSSILWSHETEIIEQNYSSNRKSRRNSTSSVLSYQTNQFEEPLDSASLLSTDGSEQYEQDMVFDCDGCLERSQNALDDPLPNQFAERFREARELVEKSVSNWFYSHRPIKYLSYLAAPYYLPMNISLALFMKYWQQLPTFGIEVVKYVYEYKDVFIDVLKRVQERSNTSVLMSPESMWENDQSLVKGQQESSESSISVKITADCRRSTVTSLTTYQCCLTIGFIGRELQSNVKSKSI